MESRVAIVIIPWQKMNMTVPNPALNATIPMRVMKKSPNARTPFISSVPAVTKPLVRVRVTLMKIVTYVM